MRKIRAEWEGAGAAPLLASMKVEGPSPPPVKPEGLGTKVVAISSGSSHEAPPQHLGSLYLAWKAGWKPSSEQEWKQLERDLIFQWEESTITPYQPDDSYEAGWEWYEGYQHDCQELDRHYILWRQGKAEGQP